MLKGLSFLIAILYLTIQYGQNLLIFGSDLRVSFYFIGMSLVQLLISFLLFKVLKNAATSFYLFLCGGAFLNELFFNGSINYIDISFGIAGIIYIFTEKRIKKWKK
tara:strand:+ start:637 stop:954 length:318 start_codon:yes stop_codon:yes gene_type:complete